MIISPHASARAAILTMLAMERACIPLMWHVPAAQPSPLRTFYMKRAGTRPNTMLSALTIEKPPTNIYR